MHLLPACGDSVDDWWPKGASTGDGDRWYRWTDARVLGCQFPFLLQTRRDYSIRFVNIDVQAQLSNSHQ